VAHSRHILSGNDRAVVIQEDLRRPEQILAHPDVTGLLDFRQPIALLLLAVLHFIPDNDDPAGIVTRLTAALPPGSYLTISHCTADSLPEEAARRGVELFQRTPTPIVPRAHADVLRLFAGAELVEPGLVWAPLWRPEDPDDLDDHPERS